MDAYSRLHLNTSTRTPATPKKYFLLEAPGLADAILCYFEVATGSAPTDYSQFSVFLSFCPGCSPTNQSD